jgi:hypothetical protein
MLKFKPEIPLSEIIEGFSIPILVFIKSDYPVLCFNDNPLPWMLIFRAVEKSRFPSLDTIIPAIEELEGKLKTGYRVGVGTERKPDPVQCQTHTIDPKEPGPITSLRSIGDGRGEIPRDIYNRFKDEGGDVYVLINYTDGGAHVVPRQLWLETLVAFDDPETGHLARLALGADVHIPGPGSLKRPR